MYFFVELTLTKSFTNTISSWDVDDKSTGSFSTVVLSVLEEALADVLECLSPNIYAVEDSSRAVRVLSPNEILYEPFASRWQWACCWPTVRW